MYDGGWSPALDLLAATLLVEVALVCFTLLGVLAARMTAQHREQAMRAAADRLGVWVTAAVVEGGAIEPGRSLLAGLRPEQARLVLAELGEKLGDEERVLLREVFVDADLRKDAHRDVAGPPWRRLRAVREARAVSDPADVLAQLAADPHAEVRLSGVEALFALDRITEAVGHLAAVAADGPLARKRVMAALAEARSLPIDPLAELVEQGTASTRQVALYGLGCAQAIEKVGRIEACTNDVDLEVRVQAVRALSTLGDPATLPACERALTDAAWEVRYAAVAACAAIGRHRAVIALAQLLDDGVEWVRHGAAAGLARCGPAGLRQLEEASSRGNVHARSALAGAAIAGRAP